MKKKITVKVDPDDLIICTENHGGGFRGGYCAVCKATGWLERLEHKLDCPLRLVIDRVEFRNFPGKSSDTPAAFAITSDGREWRLSEKEIAEALNK